MTLYYSELLEKTLEELSLADHRIEWSIDETETAEDRFPGEQNDDFFFETKKPYVVPPCEAVHAAEKHDPPVRNFVDIEPVENSLNPKYTFEKFVVGSCNQFAHAAAQGCGRSAGQDLQSAIYLRRRRPRQNAPDACHRALDKGSNPHLRVAYITSEKFMNELINAIRYDKTQAFRDKYRSIDVLLMDDVQFMAGKERTQEEFFHTFNTLHNDQKQIVVSQRLPAARDTDAGRTPALAFRMGTDRRHRTARPRDKGRHPETKGRPRRHSTCPTTSPYISPARSRATSASWKARSCALSRYRR